jgi:hypothetical protein
MASREVLAADVAKIHAEINQLLTQRFGLTAVGITLFAGVVAWANQKMPPPPGSDAVGVFVCMVSAILSGLSLVLYLLGHSRLGHATSFHDAVVEFKRRLITETLERVHGNRTHAVPLLRSRAGGPRDWTRRAAR